MASTRFFPLLAVFLVGTVPFITLGGFELQERTAVPIFGDYEWPATRTQWKERWRWGDWELELYRQEVFVSPSIVSAPNEGWLATLSEQEGERYRTQINTWIGMVEKAEADRDWPETLLRKIRHVVLQKADQIDYALIYRHTHTTDRHLVATIRRSRTGEYYRGDSPTPVIERPTVVMESVFDFRLHYPAIEVPRHNPIIISGYEINEIGGYWIVDGEDKELLSDLLLAVLVSWAEDPRIPDSFNATGRHWVAFTGAPGHRYFGARYGFKPLQGQSLTRTRVEDRSFYFDETSHLALRTAVRNTSDCANALIEVLAGGDAYPRLF